VRRQKRDAKGKENGRKDKQGIEEGNSSHQGGVYFTSKKEAPRKGAEKNEGEIKQRHLSGGFVKRGPEPTPQVEGIKIPGKKHENDLWPKAKDEQIRQKS